MLQRRGGGRGRAATRCWTDAVSFVTERLLADGPRPEAGLHRRRRPGARRAPAASARLPGRLRQGRQLGQPAVPAGRVRRGAAAVRRGGPARPARLRSLAGGRDRDRGHRETGRRARRRHLGTGRSSLGSLPADLRGRAAGHGRRRARGPGGAPGAGWPTRCWPTSPPTACTRPAAGSEPRTTNGSMPRCCCQASAGRHAPRRPADAGHAGGDPSGAQPGRLRVPLPGRRPPAGPGRGRVPALRLRHGPGPAPARPGGRGGPLVRAQPGRLRYPWPAHRGIRRHPAAGARQPAPGVRARAAAGIRPAAGRHLGRPLTDEVHSYD